MCPQQASIELGTRISAMNSEYAAWFSQVIRAVFYRGYAEPFEKPALIDTVQEIKNKIKNETLLTRLIEEQNSLHQIADEMMAGEKMPPIEEFDIFWQTYEGFSTHLKRLDRDTVLSDFGLDMQTGLRSESVMIPELEKELERRSRRGQPFSIAVLRIDNKDDRSKETAIQSVSKAVLKTIRSFDDAYFVGNGEFVISLKHSDSNGGLRFVTRFNQALKEDDTTDFTVSSCVAEPLPGDEIQVLLQNVRVDLDHICELGHGGAGQYEEVSPLNRFLQTLNTGENAENQ
ncbi:MAG: hypothetical protein RBR86_08820 [Pseudobdellovibrionaceae bacterium]|jgi:GGDEF domain-containing protein|nr:hypothetical protein [Pseudobdellovibrionaceae bacterium]